jgi:ankyrin repeat protein
VHQKSHQHYNKDYSVIALALHAGDPQKVQALLDHGADIHYQGNAGFDALLDAVYGRSLLHDDQLLDLLRLLITNGVALNSVSSYGESGLRRLSYVGRFDAVKLLLDAGADPDHLAWTPLIQAVAFGSLADVEKAVESGVPLEARDRFGRTAWHVAIQTGDIAKAQLLAKCGADMSALGRCDKPPVFYAIENHHTPMLQWLLSTGVDIEQTDEFDTTPLMTAAEYSHAEGVEILLKAGAQADREKDGQTALSFALTRDVVKLLLDAGANPQQLSAEGRRALLGFPPDPDETLLNVSPSEFRSGQSPRFGADNPEKIHEPFWEGMIRAGITAYQARKLFEGQIDKLTYPGWCAQRFGQSITFLPDGRIVQVAGEHEDYYDDDFCIYNDVFVHEPNSGIHIFGYPKEIFPPTDFHTATLIGEDIYLIGSLGYLGTRQYGHTPVYRLDTKTFRIEQVHTQGEAPGWIYKHQAIQLSGDEIRIVGGTIVTWNGSTEVHSQNTRSFMLDTKRLVWRIEAP